MKNRSRLNILLIEIMIAVLFFSLASTVILKVFMAAREQSSAAQAGNEACMALQNLSERLYASDDAEETLTESGFAVCGDGSYVLGDDTSDYILSASVETDTEGAGTARTVTLRAKIGDNELLELPCVRYFSGEAKQ